MKTPTVVALTGGIGAGKSVVSRVLRCMGYEVYDSDAEARRLMDCDPQLHRRLCRDIHPRAVVDAVIDRPLIASVVFNDCDALARLNAIVHPAVVDDFGRWVEARRRSQTLFIETALLYKCDLQTIVDLEWRVTAPDDIRIDRIMRRNGMTRAQALSRINAQREAPHTPARHIPIIPIINDNNIPLLPQIDQALREID